MPASPAAVTLASMLTASRSTAVLTGAGVSTESGLPDFRSRTGLWKQVDPIKAASIEAWEQDPVQFFRFYRQRLVRLSDARPNQAHHALAILQERGHLDSLITQNVDGLHQLAGSREVVEIHGNLREAVCLACDQVFGSQILLGSDGDPAAPVPRCPQCNCVLKPRVVLFGESLPASAWAAAVEAASSCELFVVVGTSLQVSPVNMLPFHAVHSGARLAIINLEPTPLDHLADLAWPQKAGVGLARVAQELGLDLSPRTGDCLSDGDGLG